MVCKLRLDREKLDREVCGLGKINNGDSNKVKLKEMMLLSGVVFNCIWEFLNFRFVKLGILVFRL